MPLETKGLAAGFAVLLILTTLSLSSDSTNASGFGMDSDLKDASASFWGEDGNDRSGRSVAGAGDVNGDGYDDILIGAPGNSEIKVGAGQSYLFFGKPFGWSKDFDLSNSDASFLGEASSDQAGISVAGAGDVNGDGYDDILIGAIGNDEVVADVGQTYLIFGKPTGWARDTFLSNADASFLGENVFDYSGISVSGAGDVNGDGYDDILIGAYKNDDGGNEAGQTYLILGKPTGWVMDTSLANADASFWGEDELHWTGWPVARAGDINGDGYDDVLVGSRGERTYLIFGKLSGWAMDTSLSNADASFRAEVPGDSAGRAVAGAGDVNGDGYDDILIGAYENDAGGLRAGQSYLILGKPTGWARDTFLSNADASFWGEYSGDSSGSSVAGAGDVNGDGYDDILIGAYLDEDGGNEAGQSYLILGKPTGWARNTSLSDANASFWGEDEFDWSGYSTAGVGDVNGDGCDDILIGAPEDDDPGYMRAGQTYLIFYELTLLPDYILWDVVPSALQYALPGSLNPITARVMNIGNANATSSSAIAFYNETDRDNPFQSYTVNALNTAEISQEFEAIWKAPNSPGTTHNVTIEVDYYNDVLESNETNNNYTVQFIVETPPPPPTNLTTEVTNDDDIFLNWTASDSPSVDHYLIYGSADQRDFDFSAPTYDTADDVDPLGTNWTDIDAAGPTSPREYYYTVRAVSGSGAMSITSNTAGKWTKDFLSGLNTFSLPLEPFGIRNTSWHADNVPNATFISWMDSTGHWVTHYKGTGEGINDIRVEMGRGYEISLSSDSRFTFCGYPASMIRFQEGLGDSMVFRKSLSAQKDGSDILLSWNLVPGATEYKIFRSNRRNQLHDLSADPVDVVPSPQSTWRDYDILSIEGEYYYMVIPVDSQGELGSSTYSVGVITREYQSGSDTFALSLKPVETRSFDWYCDEVPNVVGMAYMIFEVWKFHAVQMPVGIYDVEVLQGEGYQISVDGSATRYAFVGY
jgi:hypothetical protein